MNWRLSRTAIRLRAIALQPLYRRFWPTELVRCRGLWIHWGTIVALLHGGTYAIGADLHVTNNTELRRALQDAVSGDAILLAPGTYGGGLFRSDLSNVLIASEDPGNRAVIQGGTNALQLSDATNVTISDLILEGQTGNGLNIDDGGSFASPSTNVTIRNVLVRQIAGNGNLDGIKLSGVTGFLIENVEVRNWGDGGSAVDMVGSHHGLIQNSLFVHDALSNFGSGVRPKGGSKDVVIRANRFELPNGAGRAVQAGGSTDPQFFRFIDGDNNYEANQVVAEGNVVIGASSAFSFVNIDGGLVHHNFAYRPFEWTIRILNENQDSPTVQTQNGQFRNNVVYVKDTATEYKQAVNIGSQTMAETFQFESNQWFNAGSPTRSEPSLPSAEIDGVYGVAPEFTPDDAIAWPFAWGYWVVNATSSARLVAIDQLAVARQIAPHAGAAFEPLSPHPWRGGWSTEGIVGDSISLPPFSQAYLLSGPAPCDLDGNGACSVADLNRLLAQGDLLDGVDSGIPAFDLDDDGLIDNADVQQWLTWAGYENGFDRPLVVGDANLDGEANVDDFASWNLHKYQSFNIWENGDFNGDGQVDSRDLNLWNHHRFDNAIININVNANANGATSMDTVPEPTSAILLSLAFAAVSFGRVTLSCLTRNRTVARRPDRRWFGRC
ncbi:MAG: hypothetical protein R3E01_18905 [Pirellulaceae bacterium]|nr:right-handed parallel beta-helix repeat-containing protein [Planctomycetales bacterium]